MYSNCLTNNMRLYTNDVWLYSIKNGQHFFKVTVRFQDI